MAPFWGLFRGRFAIIFAQILNSKYSVVLQFTVYRGHRPPEVDLKRWSESDPVVGPIVVGLGSVLSSKEVPKQSPEASKTSPKNGTEHLRRFFTNFGPQNGLETFG